MSRLKDRFEQLARAGRKALIPFVIAGDPDPDFTVPLLHGLVTAGADIIELGVPFSDPMADGPIVQRASERALAQRMSLSKVLQLVLEFRATDQLTPIVLMGYLNPIESMGYEAFADAAQRVQVDGVLTVDLPPAEAEQYSALLKARHIDQIFLLAPNSSLARIKTMNAISSGYLYYVSLKGVTGATHLDPSEVERKLRVIRENTTLPLVIGFGIKHAATAKTLSRVADGVVVGSTLISKIEENLAAPKAAQTQIFTLVQSMRQAMDS